jgi:membrane protein implicated in regulation of membrane protease activity
MGRGRLTLPGFVSFDSGPERGEAPKAVLMLYLAALVFGVGSFLTQALFSTSGSSDAGGLDVAHDLHGALDADAGDHHAHHGSLLLSLRFYMFAALGFGIVGAPVTWLAESSPVVTFVVALGTGLGLATALSYAFRKVGSAETSSIASPSELVGRIGRVLIACEKGRHGKVRLSVQGQIVDYAATTDDERLEPGRVVIVQEVVAERLLVCAAPADLS